MTAASGNQRRTRVICGRSSPMAKPCICARSIQQRTWRTILISNRRKHHSALLQADVPDLVAKLKVRGEEQLLELPTITGLLMALCTARCRDKSSSMAGNRSPAVFLDYSECPDEEQKARTFAPPSGRGPQRTSPAYLQGLRVTCLRARPSKAS